MYAWLSSSQFDIHLPTELVIPIVTRPRRYWASFLGCRPGGSRRLLAITTLFFAQIFVELMLNLDRITPPWSEEPLDVTGGPNGIPGLDDMRIFTIDIEQVQDYYFLLLVIFALVVVGLYYINQSRTGRGWRASREDPLAAELMTTPVNRLKLLAFAMGAAVAGLTGSVFAAVQTGVFPQNFEVALLIMIYAALILGGAARSRRRAGAVIVAAVPEILRTPENARYLFYGVLIASLLIIVRPWKRVAGIFAAVIAFGFAVHEIVAFIWPDIVVGVEDGGLGACWTPMFSSSTTTRRWSTSRSSSSSPRS